MSVLSAIEAEILKLEGGTFQALCDTYLFKKTGYGNFTEYGKQTGTMKTAKGTPDTYFLKPNGKYALIQYTTAQDKIFDKIKEDIEKCLNFEKTGLDIENIDEILYCYNSSRLSVGEYENLKKRCKKENIELKIYPLNTIAHDIYFEYPIIAKEYLGISIDTGQIMKSEDFIEEYDSNKMLAPLSMKFLFRESEKNEIIEAMNSNDVVILSGQAGVGKTKLALEVVNEYKERHKYELFCIRSKNLEIYEDIKKYINEGNKYILFIDDGNELKQLELMLNLLNKSNIKIVITVRNYVRDEVRKNVKKYTNKIYEKEILGFDDKELIEFLKENMEILNPKYIEQILKLSKGNIRVAYMAGKIAKEKNNLEAIHNVEDIYESYYGMMPIKLDEKLYITGSIISIFGAIEVDDKILDEILKICNLTKEKFLEKIRKLEEFEYIEIKHENAVRILDQCFANYLLYKVFIKEKFIKLNLIIKYGFENFKIYLIRMLNMFTNLYFSKKTLDYIKREVDIVWNEYEKGNSSSLDNFVKIFYLLNETKALSYIYEKVEKSENRELNTIDLKFDSEINDDILQLFPENKQIQNLEEVFEILFEYLIKRKDLIKEAYKLIERNYGITRYSFEEKYITQITLFNTISTYIDKKEIRILFYKLAEYFLKINFLEVEDSNGHVTLYNLSLLNIPNMGRYREQIWKLLLKNINFEEKEYGFSILESFKQFKRKEYIEVKEVDKIYIVQLLEILEEFDEIRTDKIYLYLNEKYKIYSKKIDESLKGIKIKIFRIFSKIRFGKDDEKEKKIMEEFSKEVSLEEVFDNVITFSTGEKREIVAGLEYFIENFYTDIEELKKIFFYCNELNKYINFYPRTLLFEIIGKVGIDETYSIIENTKTIDKIKNNWKFIFFDLLPKESVNMFYKNKLLEFISEDNEILYYRDINILKKFYLIDNNIYINVTKKLYNKDDRRILKKWLSFLLKYNCNTSEELLKFYKEDLELLKKIYFMLEEDDYDGRFLKKFLDKDFSYLRKYLEKLKESRNYHIESNKLKICWSKENYLEIFDYIFEYSLKEQGLLYKISSIFINDNERVKIWIKHIIDKNCMNEDKMIFLFENICQLNVEIKIEFLLYFIAKNNNIETFKRLAIEPRMRSWSGSEIPLLEKDIKVYQQLLEGIEGIKFIKHKKYLKEKIEFLKERIKKIEKKEYIDKYN